MVSVVAPAPPLLIEPLGVTLTVGDPVAPDGAVPVFFRAAPPGPPCEDSQLYTAFQLPPKTLSGTASAPQTPSLPTGALPGPFWPLVPGTPAAPSAPLPAVISTRRNST